MSIISTYNTDKSGVLAKRYALLAAEFFDRPEQARTNGARVPLENLFRILEMYRRNAFSDDRRQGVLAMVSQNENYSVSPAETAWHSEIKTALEEAMANTFAETSKEDAVLSLQRSLRWLAKPDDVQPENVDSAKSFFSRFSEALA
jgi:hypothetical protein